MPAGSNRMFVNTSTNARSGTPYWRPWLIEMAKASMMPARVEPCFETRRKISPGRPSSYSPTVTKPLQSATRNSNVRDCRRAGQLLANGLADDALHDLGHHLGRSAGCGYRCRQGGDGVIGFLLRRRERLRDLAVVAVDGDRLQAALPRLHVHVLDVLDGRRLRHVDRVVVDDAVPDEGVRRGHRHVVDLAQSEVVDRGHRREPQAVVDHGSQPRRQRGAG